LLVETRQEALLQEATVKGLEEIGLIIKNKWFK
jgi:hypothetical protein